MLNNDFYTGAIAMGFAVAALFFLHYWRQSRDRLFFFFSLAFFLLSANRVLRAYLQETDEHSLVPYLVRLAAFLMILLSIIDKNLRKE